MVSRWKSFVVSLFLFFASALVISSSSVVFAKSMPKAQSDIIFKKGAIVLAGKTINIELAESEEQHSRGLMFRQSMPENEGMLFIFKDEDIRSFWMKNTYIDLSIGYFDKEKTLIDIQEMRSASMMETRPPSYPSTKPAMYALEMNKGWFIKNKVKIGQKFQFSSR